MEQSLDLKAFAFDKMAILRSMREAKPTEGIPSLSYVIPLMGEICVVPCEPERDLNPNDKKHVFSMLRDRVLTAVIARKINAIAIINVADTRAIRSNDYMKDTYNLDMDKETEKCQKIFMKDFFRYGYTGFPKKYCMMSFLVTMMGPGFEPWAAHQYYDIVDGVPVFEEALEAEKMEGDKSIMGLYPEWWGRSGEELPDLPDSAIRTYRPDVEGLQDFDSKKWGTIINVGSSIVN